MAARHRIPAPMWHRINDLLSQDNPPLSYEAIARRVGTSWRVVAAADRGEREVDEPVIDLAAGVDVAELPDDAPSRRCPGCGARLRTMTCPACRDRDLLAGGVLRKIFGGDAPHSPTIGLELRGEDRGRYQEVLAVRKMFPGTSTEVASMRSAALQRLAEQREQQERSEVKKRAQKKTPGGRTKPKRKPTRRDKAAA